VVPVINENDTVTIDELRFGDNDQLSALVATKMKADMLVILSVVDGLYPCDPTRAAERRTSLKKDMGAELIPVVEQWNEDLLGLAETSRSSLGTGGMTTKLLAMRVASLSGVHAVIACGKTSGIIDQIVAGHFRGTYFAPHDGRHLSGRDRWIAFGRSAGGRQLLIDAGARQALVVGKKSLLPAGVREIRGEFIRGDLVEVIGPEGERVAKGLVNYDSAEMERIKGKKTSQVREILGHLDYEEVIHRDNMAMIE
jgi:glutamate 5-kinase